MLTQVAFNHALRVMNDIQRRASKDPVWLYQKLRPFLRVSLPPSHTGLCRRGGNYKGHLMFYVQRGSYYGIICWNPDEPSERDLRRGMDRPTYEQFCQWYGLDPLAGMA